MNIAKQLFIIILLFVTVFTISCEKESVETLFVSEENLKLELESRRSGPQILFSLSNQCIRRQNICDPREYPSIAPQNGIEIFLNQATANFYSNLRYRIFTTGSGANLIHDCTFLVDNQTVWLTPNDLANNTQYMVVISSGNVSGSELIVTEQCLER